MSKVYARTANPEFVNWESWMEPYIEDGRFIVDGGRDLVSFNTDIFKNIKEVITDLDCYGYNVSRAVAEELKKDNGKKFSPVELSKVKEAYTEDYSRDYEKNFILICLSIIKGTPYEVFEIRGFNQGDYAEVYAPADTDREVIKDIESIYFGTGTEVIVHDAEEEPKDVSDISGLCLYTKAWDEDEIKQLVAEESGCKVEDVVLYIFDGYTQTPKYKLAS